MSLIAQYVLLKHSFINSSVFSIFVVVFVVVLVVVERGENQSLVFNVDSFVDYNDANVT